MRGEVGEASVITRRSVSPPTASSSSSGPLFPPQENDAPHSSRYLNYPEVIDPEVPPIRPERHVGNSIATMFALSPKPSREHSSGVRVLSNQGCATIYDTVRLAGC